MGHCPRCRDPGLPSKRKTTQKKRLKFEFGILDGRARRFADF
jgi:hypothetical protein